MDEAGKIERLLKIHNAKDLFSLNKEIHNLKEKADKLDMIKFIINNEVGWANMIYKMVNDMGVERILHDKIEQLESQLKELKEENRILMKGTEKLGIEIFELQKYKQFAESVKEIVSRDEEQTDYNARDKVELIQQLIKELEK